jgi:Ca-activated chloride channel homolog
MKNQFIYEQSWFFLLLLIPLVGFLFWKYLRHRFAVLLMPTITGLANKNISSILSPPVLLLLLRFLSVVFIVLGLADFKSIKTITHKMAVPQTDIILALDISKSMLIEDIKPNRLEALKDVLNKFVAGRLNDKLGIVLYAGESLYWCPLTNNYPFLLSKLNQMDEMDLADGTAIGLGLTSAVNALRQSKKPNKIIILLTDGENNTGFVDPLTAAEIARKFNIKVYTIGVGTTGRASLPIIDLNGNKTYSSIEVSIDEVALKKIADNTGGKYFRATDAKALWNIYTEIDKLEKTKVVQLKETTYVSNYRLFVLLAMFFLLLEMVLKFTLLRTWPK